MKFRSQSVHRPALTAALAFGLGILADRLLDIPHVAWGTLTLISLLSSALLLKKAKSAAPASLLLILTLFSLGGWRHHLPFNTRQSNDILTFCKEESQPARLVGVIASPIEIHEAKFGPRIPPWMEVDRSKSVLQCERVEVNGEWAETGGLLQLNVSGHVVHVRVGDQVELIGHVALPRRTANPGAVDFGAILKQIGISGTINVEHPAAILKLETLRSPRWSLARLRETLRTECVQLIFTHLPENQRGLAASLLIGDRTSLSDDMRDQFAETGTMHLLAISGLHVGIFLGIVLALCRLANLSTSMTSVCLIATVAAYAFITDQNPPVLRAGLLAAIAVLAASSGRRVDGMNALGVSALILLLWKPSDLFNVGAQLSFLAVGAILWSMSWLKRDENDESATLSQLIEEDHWKKRFQPAMHYLRSVYVMSVAVNLVTIPITMATFHLFSPVGLLLNVVLIPYFAIVLATGYLMLVGGLLLPFSAAILAAPFQGSLGLFLFAVQWGQSIPWGHFYVPAMAAWWLIGFYVLAGFSWRMIGTYRTSWWAFRALLVWIIVGLGIALIPSRRDGLRMTVLSVGHGLACVIELPSGETIAYDIGCMGDGSRAANAVAGLLWSRGVTELDAVLVSHADHDHFSGLFTLLDRIQVRRMFVTQDFLDFNQKSVSELCDHVVTKNVDLKLIQAGDQLALRGDQAGAVLIEVIAAQNTSGPHSDNSRSVVLQVDYAGRRILLPGDLEKSGLAELLTLPPRKIDVLLSPHHGGKVANVLDLYRWGDPIYAVVSSKETALPGLSGVPEGCHVLNTALSGAVTVEIQSDGTMRVSEFLK
ncbi:DNA internalization-related competence protein ComEC/Rec2 [Planctomicrobium sp. SH668]|uniref:DNA internalization-related competence protein ComEC/Rec2 n=1 Tax=Planctomicrobium sp. SH668 TaxID=3448126 RepID=UPI003F5BAF9D